MAEILSGRPLAAEMLENLITRADSLKRMGIVPTLAILRVGEDENQKSYERSSALRCGKAGIVVRRFTLPADCTEKDLIETIRSINRDDTIHGCTILLPLPEGMDARKICDTLYVEKDVDAVTSRSVSRIFMGLNGFAPGAPEACSELLDYYGCSVAGKTVCVVGRSLVVGRPVAMMMLTRNATVTVCHTHTEKLAEKCREADILISATGEAGLISAEHVRPGQVILDVGISVDSEGAIHGDVDFDAVSDTVEALTPVPGGVGIVASTILAKHVIEAAEYFARNL